jgi:hypothetical protein
MRYLRLDEWLGDDDPLPFERCYGEVGESGWVSREIGLDIGRVVYKYPWTNSPRSFRGICDMVTFAAGPDDLNREEFETLWAAPLDSSDQERSIRAIRGPSLGERLRSLFRRPGPPAS